VGLGGASRDDPNDFFFVFVFFIKSMNDQQNRTRPYGSDRYPTFLILSDVTLRNRVGIVENENGSFKANIVLAKILAVLVLIPYESHSKSRQDTISDAMKNVNTFVRTSWAQGGAPIPHHRRWVGVPHSPPPGLGRPPFLDVYSKSRINKDFRDRFTWLQVRRLRSRPRAAATNPDTMKSREGKSMTYRSGGEGGIRTHGRVSPTHAFQACSLNRSDTSPRRHAFSSVTKGGQSGKRRCETARGAKQIQRMSATISSTYPG
jgi:hypothetical protein